MMRPHQWIGISLILAGTAPAFGQTELQWQLKEGDKFYLEEKTVLKQTLKFMGRDIEHDSTFTRVTRFTVLKKNDGGVVLEQHIETVRINSASGASTTESKVLKEMEGATFQVTLDSGMHLTKFEGYDHFIKKMMKNEEVGKMFRALVPEEAFSKPTEALFGFLPDKAVAKSDQWTRTWVQPLGPLGRLATDYTFTYRGPVRVEGKHVVKIEAAAAKSTYVAPQGDSGLGFRIAKGNLKTDNKKTTATIYFDTAKGRMVRWEKHIQVNGSLTAAVKDNMLTIGLEHDETVTARVLDKNRLK
jgi:hypothetical protein